MIIWYMQSWRMSIEFFTIPKYHHVWPSRTSRFTPRRFEILPFRRVLKRSGECVLAKEPGELLAENGTLGMGLPFKINPICTLYSGYLLGISPFKGLLGGVKQLGYSHGNLCSRWSNCLVISWGLSGGVAIGRGGWVSTPIKVGGWWKHLRKGWKTNRKRICSELKWLWLCLSQVTPWPVISYWWWFHHQSGGSPVGSFYQLHSRSGQPSTVVSTHSPQIETEIDRSLSAFPVTPRFPSIFSISNSCKLQAFFLFKLQSVSCTHKCTICKLYFRIVEVKWPFFNRVHPFIAASAQPARAHRASAFSDFGMDGTTVNSLFGEDETHFDDYFSDGLKPPTSKPFLTSKFGMI